MTSERPPKAILFDIGGVCVLSPLEAIEKFENKHGIPHNWINFAISRKSDGHWQRLERGEIKLDDEFFKGFSRDLSDENSWREYHVRFKQGQKQQSRRLKDLANPSQLGDPVSLKAETSDSNLTNDDRGAAASELQTEGRPETKNQRDYVEKPELSKVAQDTTIVDPVSLEAEAVVVSSQKGDRGTATTQSSTATGDIPTSNISPSVQPQSSPPSAQLPPIPTIDVSSLFWSMMSHSRHPDPYIFPALQRLSSLPNKPLLAALSNTITFPPSHPFHTPSPDLRPYFSLFIASSEVGMRKPEPRIYQLAVQRLDAWDREHGGEGIRASDVLFLDDIGENLKAAAAAGAAGKEGGGMRTLKVVKGKTWRAVKELERVLGVELMDEEIRRAKL